MMQEVTTQKVPTDRDSEIKWKYQSVRTQTILEMISKPEERLKEVQRNLIRKPEVSNAPINLETT